MTTRFKVLCGAALLIALFVIGAAIASNTASASKFQKEPPVTPNPSGPMGAQTYPLGIPAIPIHTLSNAATNAASNSSTPAFTRNDVIAYFNAHGFYAGPLVPGAHLKILMIQFVTAKQASNLMKGESVGRPDDYLVCYVRVQGPFLLKDISAPPNAKTSPTAKIGDAVFDAHTGNLLVWGTY
jgi:hypothetical protein